MLDLTIMFGQAKNAVTLNAGDHVFEAGDESSEMYVVLDGEVDIVAGDKIVETVGPGGMFGEMALVDPAPRSASAVARLDTRLVPIDNRHFQVIIQQTPYFAIEVMSVLAHRLRRMPPPPNLPDFEEPAK